MPQQLADTRVAQPALGVTGLLAARSLQRFGIAPAAVAGHSYGEYVALCVAGAFSTETLLRLSAQRGQVVHESTASSPGAMAAVMADERATSEALRSLDLSVCLANLNSPDQTIIAGAVAQIDAAVKALNGAGSAGEKDSGHRGLPYTRHGRGGRKLRPAISRPSILGPSGCRFGATRPPSRIPLLRPMPATN